MPIQYRIDQGVLVLEVAVRGFPKLRDALQAAAADPAARAKMPLLIDVRTDVPGDRYDDIRLRVHVLAEMLEQFGSRWAILTGPGLPRVSIGHMYAVFSRIEGLEVELFTAEEAALAWLQQP